MQDWRVDCAPEHLGFSLAEILVLAGITGAGGMTSTRISARLKHVQEHSSLVNIDNDFGLVL